MSFWNPPNGGGGGMNSTVPCPSFNSTSSETPTAMVAGTASTIKASVYTSFVPATTISTTAAAVPVTFPDTTLTEISLLKKSIIISSVLGGVIILLITLLATAYCIYKQRRNGGYDSPPLISLARPPSGTLSPHI